MKYSHITDAYTLIEGTSKRLKMTEHLVSLIKKTPKELIKKVAYLSQGALYPDFEGVELGMAEKMIISAIAKTTNVKKEDVESTWKEIGDLGLTLEKLLKDRRVEITILIAKEEAAIKNIKAITVPRKPLTVERVYDIFVKISRTTTGKGTVERKVNLLAGLLGEAAPTEAKYIVRTVLKKLRLGIGDSTFLSALAVAYADGKKSKKEIEKAYNITSDLGLVAETLANEGLDGIHKFRIKLGRPIRPMLCERGSDADEIMKRMEGRTSAEYKYDGLRVQAHISPDKISLFSRRLENLTNQFPDVVKNLRKQIKGEVIVEGECLAIDDAGDFLPFQVISKRRGRKHKLEEKIKEIPVVLVLFDALYSDGKDLTEETYPVRREYLERIVDEDEDIQITHPKIITEPKQLNSFMDEAVQAGCEGLVLKTMGKDSVYKAGARNYQWIKYKRDYRSELMDTLDLVIVGAFAGRGRRAGLYGALLLAAYDKDNDSFGTISKIGTGFDDETLAKLPVLLKPYLIDHIHPRVNSNMVADFWFVPSKVLEIGAAELTLSPTHTCGLDIVKKHTGIALRFPRFTGRWRDDKKAQDTTSVDEIVKMYKSQLKTL